MASKLPGWTFLVIGVAVIAFSKFIERKTAASADPANLVVFFWVGIGFLVFGVWREFIPRLRKRPRHVPAPVGPPPQRTEPVHDHRHPGAHRMNGQSPHATHQHVAPTQHPSHPHQPSAKACPRCHQSIPWANRFCGHCGFQFS